MTLDNQTLIRPDIAAMDAYTPILPFEVLSEQLGYAAADLVKLDANENPYGPSPAALRALAALNRTVPIYPDPESRKLRAALADYVNVPAEHILCGAGADELIDLILRLFIAPGDAVLNCPPTFGMYRFDADLNGARTVSILRHPDFSLDLPAVEAAVKQHRPKLLFICSPNNPDGSTLSPADLDRLLALPLVVVLDEAYIEFADQPSAATRVLATPNLIVLRTFSKWAGLAGLRVGYGIFPLDLMAHLWKIKQPYNVNVAAEAAARASLDDLDTLLTNIARLKVERARLFDALSSLPYLDPYPSQSNFILCRVRGLDAGWLKRTLAEDHGILIRYFDKPGLSDHIRISVGTPAQTSKLLTALQSVTSE
jgi:histidinol-phosphate aminotransferase